MKILFFSSDNYVQDFFNSASKGTIYSFNFIKDRLNTDTISIAQGYSIISCSIHDELNAQTLKALHKLGVKLIALRSSGYNNGNHSAYFSKKV